MWARNQIYVHIEYWIAALYINKYEPRLEQELISSMRTQWGGKKNVSADKKGCAL